MVKKRAGLDILIRYLILVIVAIPNLWLFYTIFTPLTLYPVYWLLGLFHDVSLLAGNILLINMQVPIELIESCIAGAAYYLLLILNLATPGIKIKTRIKAILFSFVVLLIINILRIFILSLIAVSESSIFDVTHKVLWYLLSTIFVVLIWFAEVKIFKIKQIPFYSDIKFLFKKTKIKK
jgi:exosortase/archaeosortase family protein